MAVRRFPSASDSLQQSTLRDDTLIPCRYKAGTVDDSDKAIPFSLMKSTPVAVCSSASATVTKVATVDNFPDFELVNGREVIVYFVNGNTATNPSMNINGTGAIALEGGYWNSGSFMKLKYVDITVSGTRIQKWLVDLGSFNSNAQINGALTNKDIKTSVSVGENVTLVNYSVHRNCNVVSVFVHFNNMVALAKESVIISGLPLSTETYHDAVLLEHSPDTFAGYVRLNRKSGITTSYVSVEGSNLSANAGGYRFSFTYICE